MANKDCNKTIEEPDAILEQFERNRYFYGKLMSVRDFQLEQDYFRGKRHLLNCLIHGVGLVCGGVLEDSNFSTDDDGDLRLEFPEAAVAVDCWGREIVVPEGASRKIMTDSHPPSPKKANSLQDNTDYYLYLRYKPCVKDPVPALSNASACEQKCCYSRIKEDFELVLDSEPIAITGTVTVDTGQVEPESKPPIAAAMVEALQDNLVKATAITNSEGLYTLVVKEGQYTIRASASRYQQETKESVTCGSSDIDFSLSEKGNAEQRDYQTVAQTYYKEHLAQCPKCDCDDPKVLLAVLEKGNPVEVNQTETDKHRRIVYNNPMLYDLLMSHITDFENPHNVNAEQVKALLRINGLGNKTGQDLWVPEITLEPKEDTEITIDAPDTGPEANTIFIGETHSAKSGNPHRTKHAELDEVLPIYPDRPGPERTRHVSTEDANRWDWGIRTVRTYVGENYEEVKADGQGRIAIRAKGAAKFETAENEITISCEAAGESFYKRAQLTLPPGAYGHIEHEFPRLPVVDIYKQTDLKLTYLYLSEDLIQVAKISGVSRRRLGQAPTLRQVAQRLGISIPDRGRTSLRTVVGRVPEAYEVLASSTIQSQWNRPVQELADTAHVYIDEEVIWWKGLGSQASLDLRVLQYRKRVLIMNLNPEERYELMVILRA